MVSPVSDEFAAKMGQFGSRMEEWTDVEVGMRERGWNHTCPWTYDFSDGFLVVMVGRQLQSLRKQ